MNRLLFLSLLSLPLAGCLETHVVIDQPKPMDFNINFHGQLDVVIHDAREDVQKINGEKPLNKVSPEDLGLTSAPSSGTALPTVLPALANRETGQTPEWVAVSYRFPRTPRPASPSDMLRPIALKDDLLAKMATRSAQIRALWDAKAVGEAHTGLLAVKGTLTREQQKLVDDENADRSALYADEAKTKNAKPEEIALAYLLARLEYAKKGDWYEKRNAKGDWEWVQWDR